MKTSFSTKISTKTYNQLRTEASAKGFKGKNPTRQELVDFLKPAKKTYHTVERTAVVNRRTNITVAAKRVLQERGALKMAELYRNVLAELGVTGNPTLWNDLGLALKQLDEHGAVKTVKVPGKRPTYVAC